MLYLVCMCVHVLALMFPVVILGNRHGLASVDCHGRRCVGEKTRDQETEVRSRKLIQQVNNRT